MKPFTLANRPFIPNKIRLTAFGIACVASAAPLFASTAGYELVWSDEFSVDGAPDPSKWGYDVGSGGWGNNEEQFYTADRENSRIEDGRLIIEVHQNTSTRTPSYTSARLLTRGKASWKYGRVEVRAKLPSATGLWPAIWMLAQNDIYGNAYWPDNGEIDIIEAVGYESDPLFKEITGKPEQPNAHSTLHTYERNHLTSQGMGGSTFLSTLSTEFHVYGMTWDEESLRFDIDGNEHFSVQRASIIPLRNPPDELWPYWPFDQEFFLILNVAVGGSWGGHFNTGLYPQSPYGSDGIDHDASWPQRMEVDYVRVYQLSESEPTDTWKGYAIDELGNFYTNDWLGWVNVTEAPWLYSFNLNGWVYPSDANNATFSTSNQWFYVLKP
jgi:beta-glucanase (GH16 family)